MKVWEYTLPSGKMLRVMRDQSFATNPLKKQDLATLYTIRDLNIPGNVECGAEEIEEIASKCREEGGAALKVYGVILNDRTMLSLGSYHFFDMYYLQQMIGYIVIPAKTLKQAFNTDWSGLVERGLDKTVRQILEHIVNSYEQYVSGDCFCYELYDKNGLPIESRDDFLGSAFAVARSMAKNFPEADADFIVRKCDF